MRPLLAAILLLWPGWVFAQGRDQTRDLTIVYLSREGDPAYAARVAADGVAVPAAPRPRDGAELALRDVRALARATGLNVKLEARALAEGEAVAPALFGDAVVADLAGPDLLEAAKAAAGRLAVFNIREDSDALRKAACALSLFHVPASVSMQTDALVQFIVRRNWKRVLSLTGPLEADQAFAASFAASAKKFGARIVADKPFVLGNDPRKREQNSVALMSYAEDFDVAFVADTARDFGRTVPFALARPRPTIGSVGLTAADWDAQADRFGAPQVNNRFARLAHRPMTPGDWATWVAVRAVVEAAGRGGAKTPSEIVAKLGDGSVQLDVTKGVVASFRPWDHQLRQPVMLRTADVVVDYAPIDGFLAQTTALDTLGLGPGEVPCKSP